MNDLEIKRKILDKIKEYDKIILVRHTRPDGDAVGSTKGLQAILRASFPEKTVLLLNEDYADYTAFLGAEDAPIPDEEYAGALVLALDTGTADRLSNKKTGLAREIVKIDHHIEDKPYGDLCWIEEHRSSTCEMIVNFYDSFREELKLPREAAEALFVGMVTDSGRFRYRETSGDTLRMAAILLETGIDTDRIYAQLYLEDFASVKREADILRSVKMTPNGVCYLYISLKMQEKYGMTSEQASNTVNTMDKIKGSMIWIAFIENKNAATGEESIRVRLRSRFVEVQPLACSYRGGGHACAAGATVYNRKEVRALLADADRLLGDFKAQNPDCL